MVNISVIIPLYNEKENIARLHRDLVPVIRDLDAEILLVDDGSDDGSSEEIKKFSEFTYIAIPRSGKSMALKAGLEKARGQSIVMIDADLQEDPTAILLMLERLRNGTDCVTGWRKERKDSFWGKRLPSKIFNLMISALFWSRFNDINCGFKACSAEKLRAIPWFDGCHRFIPLLIEQKGGKTSEVIVSHRVRKAGKAKFSSPARFFEAIIHLVKLRLGKYE